MKAEIMQLVGMKHTCAEFDISRNTRSFPEVKQVPHTSPKSGYTQASVSVDPAAHASMKFQRSI